MRRRTTLIKRLALPALLYAAVVTAFAAPAVPARYSGEPRTIAHDFLEIEKGLGTAGDQAPTLNALIGKAAVKIPARKSYTTEEAIGTLQAIDQFLKSEGFTFKNNYLLGVGLKTEEDRLRQLLRPLRRHCRGNEDTDRPRVRPEPQLHPLLFRRRQLRQLGDHRGRLAA